MKKHLYLLDTNIVNSIIRTDPMVMNNLKKAPPHSYCISSITEAELLYGLEKNANTIKLQNLVHFFLSNIDVLAWDSNVAKSYSKLRTSCEKDGKSLSVLNMLIASHAYSLGLSLITNDHAFYKIKDLKLEDWTKSIR